MDNFKSSNIKLKKLIRRGLSPLIAGVFLINTLFSGLVFAQPVGSQPVTSTLAPPAAMQNPKVKRELTASMYRAGRLIWLANSPRYLDLLARYNALALLLPSGRYLMAPETAKDDLSLIRACAHEDYEILMQKEESRHTKRYNRLMRELLARDDIMAIYRKLSGYKDTADQPDNIIFNDLIAKSLELLFIVDETLVYPERELSKDEQELLALMRPILEAKDSRGHYKNFSQVFFDVDRRTKAIQALQEDKSERFYRVASTYEQHRKPDDELNSILQKIIQNETLDKGELGRLGYLTLEDNIQRRVFNVGYMGIEPRIMNRVELFRRLALDNEFHEYLQTHRISLLMLWNFYAPLAESIINRHNEDKTKTVVIGINGGPGSGKSTTSYILNRMIASMLDGEQVVSISLDDFYLSKSERIQKGVRWRGPPGTHDLEFAQILTELKQSNEDSRISVPRFDKSQDDRKDTPDVINGKVGIVLFDGWLVGVDEEGYDAFSKEVDYMIHLSADIDDLKQWRLNSERELHQSGEGGFSDAEMDIFWNDTLLPAIEKYREHIKQKADMVVQLDKDHAIIDVTAKDIATVKKHPSILLIDPHYRKEKIYGPPLGLAYVASKWQPYGRVGTADFNITGDISNLKNFRQEEQQFLDNLSRQMDDYDIVGVTVTTGVYPRALKIAKLAKSKGKIVIFGGPQITLIASQSIWKSRIFEDSEDSVDILVKGEGDITAQEIVEHLSNDLTLTDIKGISYRIFDGYFFNATRKPMTDLDELPFPAWEAFPFRTLPRVAFLSAARGCPNKCKFCDERIIMPRYRIRSVASIMEEINHNAKLGITRYRIADSTFSAYPHMEELLDKIIASGIQLQFVAYARVDDILKMRHLLPKMKRAGLVLIYIGVESGSQRILDAQNKGTTLSEIEEAVGLCRQAGIKIKGSFIIGLVGETEEDIKRTIAFAKKLNLDVYSWHILAPSIGSLKQVPDYSDIDWKYVDVDVPDELIPEVATELGDKARNLMIERHTAFKFDDEIPSDMPLHISGFTFAELYRLLKLAIEETRQDSSAEATYLHMDVSGTYVSFEEFKRRIARWLPASALDRLDDYFENKLTIQEQEDFVHRRFSKILEIIATMPELIQDEGMFGQIIKSDLLNEAIRSFNSYSSITRPIASNGKPGAIVGIADGKDAIILGDLHGRYQNFDRVLQDERNMDLIARGEAHLIVLGDAVIPSLRALIKIMALKAKYPKHVHYIPGNNDDLMVTDERGIHQIVYTEILKQEFGEEVYAKCQEFIRQCPVAIKLKMGREYIWLSHSEIPEGINSEDEIRDLLVEGYTSANTMLHELLWLRRFDAPTLEESLRKVNSRVMITGHTTMKQLKEILDKRPETSIQFIEDGKVAIVSNRHIVIDAQEEEFAYLKVALTRDLSEVADIRDSVGKKAFKQIRTSPIRASSAGAIKQAFGTLNTEARKVSQLNSEISRLRGTSQNLMEVTKYRFCVPVSVLKNSPDITHALNTTGLLRQRGKDSDKIEFELVVTGVTDEDLSLIEGLNREDIRKALDLPEKFTVSTISERQMQETASRFSYDIANPKHRVAIVKDFFSGTLASGEYMAIATDALGTEDDADRLHAEIEKEFKQELSHENISVRVLVGPERGRSMFSLSKIINDWLEAINQGNLSSIAKILPVPAPLTPELERAIKEAWAVLTAA